VTTKKDIVKDISARTGLSQIDTKRVVQNTFEAILDTLVKESRIELRNFGIFIVKERAERKARNPRTGQEVVVPSKKVVIFRPGRRMEELVK
jgi:nucleoid DNA-binding protein